MNDFMVPEHWMNATAASFGPAATSNALLQRKAEFLGRRMMPEAPPEYWYPSCVHTCDATEDGSLECDQFYIHVKCMRVYCSLNIEAFQSVTLR